MADGGGYAVEVGKREESKPATANVKPPARRKLSDLEVMRLKVSLAANNEALRLGTHEARALATRVAKLCGFPDPFGPSDARLRNSLPSMRKLMVEALLKAPKDKTMTAAAIERLVGSDDGLRPRGGGLLMRSISVIFGRPHNGVKYDAASQREAVRKAVRDVLRAITASSWDSDDCAIAILRAAYRAMGGSPRDANNMLRERT